MEFHFGKFGTPDHCGKDTRKYLYVMGGLAIFILLATYVYEYHYLAGKQARQDVAAVNQTQGQAVQFASAPSSLGMNVMTPINSTATMAGAPLAPAQRVVFQNNPSMMMPVDNPPPRPQFNSVVQGLRGSIVSITASQSRAINRPVAQGNGGPRFAEPMIGSNSESIGSGVVVSNNGYIVTNYHVVKNSTGLMVTLFGKRGSENFRADMVKQDPSLDLALLKIQPNDPTQPAPLGDSSQLQVADSVIAIGSPFGLDLTVSRGIVSGMRRAIVIDGVTHDQMIQTDAAINQGNSGGAMINRDGEVIGINTAIYTPTGAFAGIGFAIPVNKVKGFIQDQVSLTDMAPGQGNSMQMLDPLPIRRQTMSGTQMQNVAAPQGPPIRANAMPPANHSDGRDRMACATCHQTQIVRRMDKHKPCCNRRRWLSQWRHRTHSSTSKARCSSRSTICWSTVSMPK